MPELSAQMEDTLRQAMADADALRTRILELLQQTGYEDLEHGALGLDIVHHVIDEVLEHSGLGGHIEGTSDPDAHRQAESWKADVERILGEAKQLLTTHDNEDLENAIKALTVAEGSLEEVAERYE
jgi:hypothetical protein